MSKKDEIIREGFSAFLNDTATDVFKEQKIQKHKEEQTLRKYYVYALCENDEKNKKLIPFYIGKGTGDRVWNHADETEKLEIEEEARKYNYSKDKEKKLIDQVNAKHKKIEELLKSGKDKISYIIIKSGLTEYESFMCESALINLLKLKVNDLSYADNDLTNIVNGHSNYFEKFAGIDTQALSVDEYYKNYCKKPIIINQLTDEQKIIFSNKKIRLQNINTTYSECTDFTKFPTQEKQNEAIRNAVCGFWRIDEKNDLDYVFAVYQGRIKGIYKVEKEGDASIFHKILETSRSDYPRFDQLYTRQKDLYIAETIIRELKLDPKDPYSRLDENSIYGKLSKATQNEFRNMKQSNGKKSYFEPSKSKKVKTEIEGYNIALKNWSKRKYFVLKDITADDIKPGEPDFRQYINCSIKMWNEAEQQLENIFKPRDVFVNLPLN